jgi:hypothetical protein
MGDLLSDRKLITYDIRVGQLGAVAVVEFGWRFNGEVSHRGRETSVFRRTDGAWRIVHGHYSGVPSPRSDKVSDSGTPGPRHRGPGAVILLAFRLPCV